MRCTISHLAEKFDCKEHLNAHYNDLTMKKKNHTQRAALRSGFAAMRPRIGFDKLRATDPYRNCYPISEPVRIIQFHPLLGKVMAKNSLHRCTHINTRHSTFAS